MLEYFRLSAERPIRRSGDDCLALGRFVEDLTAVLVAAESSSFIGLHSPWGSGKTSVLNLVKERFEKSQPETLVVIFDAWDFENDAGLLPALLQQLARSLPEKSPPSICWAKVAQAVLLGLSDLALHSSTGGVMRLKDVKATLADLDAEYGTTENPEGMNSEFTVVERWIATALLLTRREHVNRIVFLVDDLDRCHPDNVFAFIDHLRRLVALVERLAPANRGFPSIVGLLAFDEGVIDEAVRCKYPALRAEPTDYLYKLFNFTIRLPVPGKSGLTRLAANRLGDGQRVLEKASGEGWNTTRDRIAGAIADLAVQSGGQVTSRHICTLIRHILYSCGSGIDVGLLKSNTTEVLAASLIAIVAPVQFAELLRCPDAQLDNLIELVLKSLEGHRVAPQYQQIMHVEPDAVWSAFKHKYLLNQVRVAPPHDSRQVLQAAAEMTGVRPLATVIEIME